MRVYLFLFCFEIFVISSFTAAAQSLGCMDTRASNYNPNATISNGSCVYNAASVSLKDFKKATLPEALKEISDIIYFNGKLYGHNDGGGEPALYEIDTTSGTTTKTIMLRGASNIDWEDIAQDENNIYVGDFGNNERGNRTDLAIYKFPKTDILNSGTEVTIPSSDIDVIHFKYQDQVEFIKKQTNSTRFDCEAFFYKNGFLHLFTKN